MVMASQFKLVPKMQDNKAIIYFVTQSGDIIDILHVMFPYDYQLNDNMEVLDEMVKLLTKRIRKSI